MISRFEVRSGAGSGTTWMAVEQARRLTRDGQRVALLCFSRGSEIRLMLDTLDHLHLNGVSHRDITPANVFLGPRSTLKLGDFGIAALAKLSRGACADAYAPAFKPPNVTAFWTPADDVYQVGLLAMTLLKARSCSAA